MLNSVRWICFAMSSTSKRTLTKEIVSFAKTTKRLKTTEATDGVKKKTVKKTLTKVRTNIVGTLCPASFANDATTKNGQRWNWKCSSWNVCGIRAWLQKGGLEYVVKENPDVFLLQETRCTEEELPAEIRSISGYHTFWHSSSSKKGYAGVGLLSKMKPLNVRVGFGSDVHDGEGRLITAEYEKFFFVGSYVPNSGAGKPPRRLSYRRQWNNDLLIYLKELDAIKPVIYCGDLNVAHEPIDLEYPQRNAGFACFTDEEREDFSLLLKSGFVDSFRCLNPTKRAYSFWSFRNGARQKNIGWRLDYSLVSERLVDNLCDCVMRPDVLGSDHCPVTLFMAM